VALGLGGEKRAAVEARWKGQTAASLLQRGVGSRGREQQQARGGCVGVE
jgi:hypothetical protein